MPHDELAADVFPEPVFLEGAAPTPRECTIAMLAHFGGLVFSFIPAAIPMRTQRNKSHYIVRHAREAVNYQITLFCHALVSTIPAAGIGAGIASATGDRQIGVLAGCAAALVLFIILVIFEIMLVLRACLAAAKGREFRYPLTIRLF